MLQLHNNILESLVLNQRPLLQIFTVHSVVLRQALSHHLELVKIGLPGSSPFLLNQNLHFNKLSR